MFQRALRKTRLEEAIAQPDLRARAAAALALHPLCDHCLGRLFAQVDTGLSNLQRGRIVRAGVGGPPAPPSCWLCHNLFDAVEAWAVRAIRVLDRWEFDTFAVTSHADPAAEEREAALWTAAGGDLAEPYKQAFNRLLGIALSAATGRQPDLAHPDVTVRADHATGKVGVRANPFFVCGRYRKLARGLPQSRWRTWPTSVQQIVGDPLCREADGTDHLFHGCGREDTDVRCLGERPFAVEIIRPRKRHLDLAALAAAVNASGQVEVIDLKPCTRDDVVRIKSMRPEKTYRALARLSADVSAADCGRLATLVGVIRQQTPTRVLRRRPNLVRERGIVSLDWRQIGPRDVEIVVRTQAGTYIKELVSGDSGRTRPSVAEVLGSPAECAELDVIAIHVDGAPC
jgi:tRNA pseudouridine synthase 10